MANVLTSWKEDPIVSYIFSVTVDGLDNIGLFASANGLNEENEIVFYKQRGEGGKLSIKKVPGQYKWGDITLKRGVTKGKEMWAWRQLVVQGKMTDARKDGAITVYSTDLTTPVATWKFVAGWPSKWEGGDLAADSDEVFAETLTIAHEGLSWE